MPQPEPPEKRPSAVWIGYALLAFLLALGYLGLEWGQRQPSYEVSYSRFSSLVDQGVVSEVTLRGELVTGRLNQPVAIGPNGESADRFSSRIPAFGDDDLLDRLEAQGVEIRVSAAQGERGIYTVLLAFLPWLIFIGFIYLVYQRASRTLGGRVGGPAELKRFLEAPAKQAEVPEVTFADVAGQPNAKREVAELVQYLREPETFTKLGAQIPRGVLLMGPPGTGKTLMARALAGEAGVPFFSISGSEFIEVFVGVGASRVRRLFETAKQQAPSIIFIDELDSVGRTRGTGLGGGHDEREQTLNQILAEMDGFAGHEAVIVLAATNRPDVLDPALLRPGRFDRHVTLDLPDKDERREILELHSRKVPLAADVSLDDVAAGTPGFSGADLKNLVNEAAIMAARERLERVNRQHFDEARDKLMMGTVRTLAIQPEERHRLAVHEAGHTLVAFHLPHADPIYKVTIIPRGRALGGTQQLPLEERHTLPEDYLRDRLAVVLAGRQAERELLGTVSSGADQDIHEATVLARAMVARWGMSDAIGPIDLRESDEHPFLGREIAQPRRHSEHSARAIDEAVHRLLVEAEQRALEVIRTHRPALASLIETLESRETLDREDVERALAGPAVRQEPEGDRARHG